MILYAIREIIIIPARKFRRPSCDLLPHSLSSFLKLNLNRNVNNYHHSERNVHFILIISLL